MNYRYIVLVLLAIGTEIASGNIIIWGSNPPPVPGLIEGSGTAGYEFTVGNNDIVVTALGLLDYGADGLADPHDVAIWNVGGDLIAQATLASGTGNRLQGDFRYQDIVAPVVLSAQATYVIGAFYPNNSFDSLYFGFPSIDPGIGIASAGCIPRFDSGSTLAFPGTAIPSDACGYFGPNIEYSVVPEPSVLGLLATGIFMAWCFGMRRKPVHPPATIMAALPAASRRRHAGGAGDCPAFLTTPRALQEVARPRTRPPA